MDIGTTSASARKTPKDSSKGAAVRVHAVLRLHLERKATRYRAQRDSALL